MPVLPAVWGWESVFSWTDIFALMLHLGIADLLLAKCQKTDSGVPPKIIVWNKGNFDDIYCFAKYLKGY